MTSLRKHIIPLQKVDSKLAFNIQSYDTIKYSAKNISSELDRAIKDAIRISESKDIESRKKVLSDKSIIRKFEIADFVPKDHEWYLNDAVEDTNFRGFGHHSRHLYLFLGKTDSEQDFNDYLEETDVVIRRINKKYSEKLELNKNLENEIAQLTAQKSKIPLVSPVHPRIRHLESEISSVQEKLNASKELLDNMANMFFGFVNTSNLDDSNFSSSINDIISSDGKYKFAISKNGLITFDDLSINLEASSH